jgi:hypothetical protein
LNTIPHPEQYCVICLPNNSAAAVAAALPPNSNLVHMMLSVEKIPMPYCLFEREGSATCRVMCSTELGQWVTHVVIPTAELPDDWEPIGFTFDLDMARWRNHPTLQAEGDWLRFAIDCFDDHYDCTAAVCPATVGEQSPRESFSSVVLQTSGITPITPELMEGIKIPPDHLMPPLIMEADAAATDLLPQWILDLAAAMHEDLCQGRIGMQYNGDLTTVRVESDVLPTVMQCAPTLPMAAALRRFNGDAQLQ